MFAPDDIIAAIATPPGRGGIGVVRISGPRAHELALGLLTRNAPLEPRYATFTRVRLTAESTDATTADEVVATFFPAPHSYTGQDTVEIGAHGSPVVLHAIVNSALAAGARLAEPGEFTLRAFLSGKRDLVQAEAVADLIDAVTPLQARTAFDQLQGTLTTKLGAIDGALYELIAKLEASIDFPDEGYHFIASEEIAETIEKVALDIRALLEDADRGRLIREGAHVVIAGRPNVGKSSIFNALAGADRAIVTEIPGTTRDLITERVDIGGLAVTLVDTAGVRDTLDLVEREGVLRGDRARDVADLVLVVLDASAPLTLDDERLLERTARSRRLIVWNKSDCASDQGAQPWSVENAPADSQVRTSALTSEGLDQLREGIAHALTGREPLRDSAAVSNARHIALLKAALTDLDAATNAAHAVAPEEFVLADLQAARQRFDEIVGRRTADDLLAHIFERFCIGK